MLQLFLLGALGPRPVGELGISATLLGLTTTIGFGTAALLSPVSGRIVDWIGPRRGLVVLLLVAAAALAAIGAAPGAGLLLGAVALGGLPQALANPATNKAILAIPAERRGAVTGLKQSGVQLGEFAAGLPLAALAGGIGWRGAVWTAVRHGVTSHHEDGQATRRTAFRHVRTAGDHERRHRSPSPRCAGSRLVVRQCTDRPNRPGRRRLPSRGGAHHLGPGAGGRHRRRGHRPGGNRRHERAWARTGRRADCRPTTPPPPPPH
ncbi:MFS transporter [Streptomyces sp. NPDC007883]|uniref:MFS transporter n=1 Tax=Streptomyces sp. NPDC007883 TaxID=3155116 RepID=UPI0033F828D0